MNEAALLENWRSQKSARTFYRLMPPQVATYEYLGQYGHPSSYARVRFQCKSADELSLEFATEWPAAFTAEYTTRIRCAVAEAVVDGLVAGDFYPFTGCALTLEEFGWDDIGGSEGATYRATVQAMKVLRDSGTWTLVRDHGHHPA